jgi:hypothetical protein
MRWLFTENQQPLQWGTIPQGKQEKEKKHLHNSLTGNVAFRFSERFFITGKWFVAEKNSCIFYIFGILFNFYAGKWLKKKFSEM